MAAALPAYQWVYLLSLCPCLEENEADHYKALAHQNIYKDSYCRVYFLHCSVCGSAFIQGSLRKPLGTISLMMLFAGLEMLLIFSDQHNSLHEFQPGIQGNLIICCTCSICLLIFSSLSRGRNLPVLHRHACIGEIKESKQGQ